MERNAESIYKHELTPLLDTREVAKLLGVKPAKLRDDRAAGRGIPFIKMGRAVRYNIADVQAYLAKCRVGGAA